jgi:polysaccharide biosynthesis protein PslJ
MASTTSTALTGATRRPTGGELTGVKRRADVVSILTVYVVLLLLIPAPLVVGALGAAGTPAGILGVVCLVWWFVALVLPDSGIARGFEPIRAAIIPFAVAITLSYILAFTRFLESDEVRSADRAMLTFAAIAGVALLCAEGIHSWDRLETLWRRFTIIGTGLAGLGILQFFTGFDIAPLYQIPGLRANSALFGLLPERSQFRRVAATATHPIEFGVLMAVVLCFALHYASIATDDRVRRRRWVAVAMIVASIAMSVSRSGIVGMVAGGAVMLSGWAPRRRVNVLAAGVVFLGSMRLVIPGLVGTLKNMFTNITGDSSYQARQERLPQAFHLIHEHWVFGRGPGTLLPAHYPGIVPLDNQLLATAIELGVVGLIALILMMIIGICTARGARRRFTNPIQRDFANAVAGGILICLLSFYTFDAYAYPMVTGSMALLLGTAGALWRMSRNRSPETDLDAAAPATTTA